MTVLKRHPDFYRSTLQSKESIEKRKMTIAKNPRKFVLSLVAKKRKKLEVIVLTTIVKKEETNLFLTKSGANCIIVIKGILPEVIALNIMIKSDTITVLNTMQNVNS